MKLKYSRNYRHCICIDFIYRNCQIFGRTGRYYVHPINSLEIYGPFDILVKAKKAAYDANFGLSLYHKTANS